MNLDKLLKYMVSMMNVSESTAPLMFGNIVLKFSITYVLLLLLRIESFVFMEVYLLQSTPLMM